jgi:choline dehydrogenase-like flavoprotein
MRVSGGRGGEMGVGRCCAYSRCGGRGWDGSREMLRLQPLRGEGVRWEWGDAARTAAAHTAAVCSFRPENEEECGSRKDVVRSRVKRRDRSDHSKGRAAAVTVQKDSDKHVIQERQLVGGSGRGRNYSSLTSSPRGLPFFQGVKEGQTVCILTSLTL